MGADSDPEDLARKATDPQGPWQQQPGVLYHRFSDLCTGSSQKFGADGESLAESPLQLAAAPWLAPLDESG